VKIAVFGYHNIGHDCLEHLVKSGEDVAVVFTHDDDPGEEIYFRSVAELARENGILCYSPEDLREPQWVEFLRDTAPDIIFSFYYRFMIPKEILGIPRFGAMNMHGSLLPKYRGRCPVNWVLINGDTETGVTLHYMVEKPDAGDIVGQKKVEISFEDTALTLMGKLEKAAVLLLEETWPLIKEGKNERTRMDLSRGSYFGGRKPEDGLIDWLKTSTQIYNLIRAVTHPYPGAFTYHNGRKMLIWSAVPDEKAQRAGLLPGSVLPGGDGFSVVTGGGLLKVIQAQMEGQNEVSGAELARTAGLRSGEVLGRETQS
jgi:methionyl-tRNA formyltransferase